MSETLFCTEPSRWNGGEEPGGMSPSDDVVHRYVAGTLPQGMARELEIHMLSCSHCVARVREAVSFRAGLRTPGPPRASYAATLPRNAGGRAWHRGRGVQWLPPGIAAAAMVGVLLLTLREKPLERLGRVATPPAYDAITVRASRDSASVLTDSAVAAYASGQYMAAERLLSRVAEVRPTPGAMFFLGVSRLLTDRHYEAIDALRGALEPSGNPYVAEARYYLAKAWLRAGNADSAIAQLSLIPAASKLHLTARALEDSARSVRR